MGEWRLATMRALDASLNQTLAGTQPASLTALDGSAIGTIDTAAALLVARRLRAAGHDAGALRLAGFSPANQRILEQVIRQADQTDAEPPAPARRGLALLGRTVEEGWQRIVSHLGYLGLVLATFGAALRHPTRFRPRELLVHLQSTGLTAVPVVSLVMFLIGAVMAYLLGQQAEQYGANIYVVDGVAIGIVREFSPLLVATIVAGRSGASFTAQLGTMKLTEETDAIRTLGLSANQVLLLPRVLALMIALPLLVFAGSVMGLVGAAAICDLLLGITPETFFERMRSALSIRHHLIGLFKAPVFALVIAVIGCAMGMSVERDTRSIGQNTTATVVQCIVAVVLLDAVFALLFQAVGW